MAQHARSTRDVLSLQDGLKLDLDSLAKKRFILRGFRTSRGGIALISS
jgi:hypothetical protein